MTLRNDLRVLRPGRPARASVRGGRVLAGEPAALIDQIAEPVLVQARRELNSGPTLRGTSVRFPHSQGIPTSIPSEFPCIDVNGSAHGQDEMGLAIQTTSASKVRRGDFGDCGPPQPNNPSG